MHGAPRGTRTGSSPRRWVGSILLALALATSLVVATDHPAPADEHGAGELDPTFDDDGIAITEISSQVSDVLDAEVQVLSGGGERLLVLDASGRLWRFLPDGSLDVAFDDEGVLPVSDDPPYLADQLEVMPDGRFVVSGVQAPNAFADDPIVVVRHLPDGARDADFGDDGVALLTDGASNDGGPRFLPFGQNKLALQADGAVVLVGPGRLCDDGNCFPGESESVIVGGRLDADGDPGSWIIGNSPFGQDPFESYGNYQCCRVHDVTVDDQDRVVVSGSFDPGVSFDEEFAFVIRLDPPVIEPDGQELDLDESFDAQPVEVETQTMPVVVHPDGTIAAVVCSGFSSSWRLLQWDDDGSQAFDPVTVFPSNLDVLATDLDVGSDGTLFAVGLGTPVEVIGIANVVPPEDRTRLVTSTWTDGDRSFGGGDEGGPDDLDGVVTEVPAPGGAATPQGVALSDDSFRAVWRDLGPALVDGAPTARLWLSGFSSSGELDEDFGADTDHPGHVAHAVGGIDRGRALAVESDGRILVGGDIETDGYLDELGYFVDPYVGFLLRHQEPGPLDPTLNPDADPAPIGPRPGVLVTGDESDAERSMSVLGLDRHADQVAVAGTAAHLFSEGADHQGAVHLRDLAGEPVPEFNGGLPLLEDTDDLPWGGSHEFRDVAVQPDGRIVVVGDGLGGVCEAQPGVEFPECPFGHWIVVARFLPDGTPDPTFGIDIAGTPPGPDGAMFIGPVPSDPDYSSDHAALGTAVALQDDGGIVVTGAMRLVPDTFPGRPGLMVARLDPDGTLDEDFAVGLDRGYGAGVLVHDIGAADGPDVVASAVGDDVVVDGEGRIVVAGSRMTELYLADPVRGGFVARLDPVGTFDDTFDGDGFTYPFADVEATGSVATGVAIDAVGQLVVTGASVAEVEEDDFGLSFFVRPAALSLFHDVDDTEPEDVLLARVSDDGELDPVFGDAGVVTTDTGVGGGERAEDVAIAPDGKIVVTGHVTDDRSTRVLVARYLPGVTQFDCVADPTDFGSVQIDDDATRTVTCTAVDGRVSVALTQVDPASPNAGDFSLGTDTCSGAVLDAGESCEMDVTFDPGALGQRTATLDIATSVATGPLDVDVALVGRATPVPGAPAISATPDPRVFAERLVTTTSNAGTITISSVGDRPLTISTVGVVGADASDFTVVSDSCAGATLAPAATCTVDVTFRPRLTTDLVRTARLRVGHNAPGSPLEVGLRGTVTEPTIAVDPGQGPGSTEVEVTGTGYASGVPVRVRLDGSTVVTVPGGQVVGGSFTSTFVVAAGAPGGVFDVVGCQACDGPDEWSASTTFTVTPTISVDPGEGPIETEVEVTGRGYLPGVAVRILLNGSIVVTVPGSQVVGGSFTITFVVPEGTPGGELDVDGCQRCGTPDEFAASTTFTVTPRVFIEPVLGTPGSTPLVTGDGFVPAEEVVVDWDRGIGAMLVTPDANGEIIAPILVFHKDLLGDRELQATPTSTPADADPPAVTDYLVVPGSSQPGDFVARR